MTTALDPTRALPVIIDAAKRNAGRELTEEELGRLRAALAAVEHHMTAKLALSEVLGGSNRREWSAAELATAVTVYGLQEMIVAVDHEHCAGIGRCWQDNYPCPELNR